MSFSKLPVGTIVLMDITDLCPILDTIFDAHLQVSILGLTRVCNSLTICGDIGTIDLARKIPLPFVSTLSALSLTEGSVALKHLNTGQVGFIEPVRPIRGIFSSYIERGWE
jgi:hypothetical protein